MKKVVTACLVLFISWTSLAQGQAPDYSQLDPKPYNPETDPNIDMFMNCWKNSPPRHTHGSLLERDIFTQCNGDPLHPSKKGAVLTGVKRFTYGTLFPLASTSPTTLKGEQEIFYIESGQGTITAGNITAELKEGVGVLMPPGVEFTLQNTGDKSLTMYIISETIPQDFTPNREMIVRDENSMPLRGSTGHWAHIDRSLFRREDGLAVLYGMNAVWYAPMTIGQPHSHGEGIEEVWFSLKGDVIILLGKQLRKLSPGTAYKIPPNGMTPHSNINVGNEPIKMFWFMTARN